MRKAFISYSSQDAVFAAQLASELQRTGIGVWFDQWEIRAGDSLIAKISEGLETQDFLVVILSPASIASAWVQKELNTALIAELDKRKAKVIPVLYRDCNIPAFLKEKKYADFRHSFAKGMMEVRNAIAPELFIERQKCFVGNIIGVDFGTSKSMVSIIENGVPRILPNYEGNKSTPSVAALTPDGEWIAGIAAVAQSENNPHRTFYSIKSQFGTDFKVLLDGKTYHASDIAAVIFRKMKFDAEQYLGRTVQKVVLTCPARFTQRQRIDLRSAAIQAGLDVLRLVAEPTAAILSYGIHRILSSETIYNVAIYDLGGGSFDISIVIPGGGVVEVGSVWGDTHLGGNDFDTRLYEYCAEIFKNQHGIDIRKDAVAAQRLRMEVEAAKIVLSGASSVHLFIRFIAFSESGTPLDLDITVSRNEFQSMTKDLVERTIACCNKALDDFYMPPSKRELYRVLRFDQEYKVNHYDLWKEIQSGGESDPDQEHSKKGKEMVDEVILCGLSTKMPSIRSAVRDTFGLIPICRIDPDEVVALGAAIQAGVLEGLGTEQETLLLDTIPISVGIELKDGSFFPILYRQTTIPVYSVIKCTVETDCNSIVVLKLYEGEADVCSKNEILCTFQIKLQNKVENLIELYVIPHVDANSVIKIRICDIKGNELTVLNVDLEFQQSFLQDSLMSNIISAREEDEIRQLLLNQKWLNPYQ